MLLNKIILYYKRWRQSRQLRGILIYNWRETFPGLDSTFEGANRLFPGAHFKGHMGYGSYLGENCSIEGTIGRFTSIAPFVDWNPGSHPYTYPYVSTSPMFFSLKTGVGKTFAQKQCYEEIRGGVIIGNDCWIGQHVFLVGGLTINDGAVVLSGATVTKDIPPFAIVGGVPAKIIGYRYDESTIKWLLDIKWWNNDISWFEENWMLLNDIEQLKKYYNSKSL